MAFCKNTRVSARDKWLRLIVVAPHDDIVRHEWKYKEIYTTHSYSHSHRHATKISSFLYGSESIVLKVLRCKISKSVLSTIERPITSRHDENQPAQNMRCAEWQYSRKRSENIKFEWKKNQTYAHQWRKKWNEMNSYSSILRMSVHVSVRKTPTERERDRERGRESTQMCDWRRAMVELSHLPICNQIQ